MILLDPPTWPAHGTHWSHLVSDASLHELRTFARAHGVPDRSFDLDHYDVPADRHDELVGAGAAPVDGRELARRLAASGLRVPGRERRRAARPALLARWHALWPPDGGAPVGPVRAVGEDLVERWREPHRVYHSRLHLADVLDALDVLTSALPAAREHRWRAAVALWFHDAVHDGEAGRDEERSASLARELLTPLAPADDVEEVVRLVLLTARHDPAPGDLAGALVCDADLAILGSSAARYARYVHQVRAEYGHVPDEAFRTGRAAVLQQLLTLPALFRTPAGHERWAATAQANLRRELRDLRDGGR